MVAISSRGQDRNVTSEVDKKGNQVLCWHIFDPTRQKLPTYNLGFQADWLPLSHTIFEAKSNVLFMSV